MPAQLKVCLQGGSSAMIRRTAVFCFLLLGSSLPITVISCGYTSNFRGPEEPVVTPTGQIQHIVVIYQENVSFDHYFGTYPNALNLPGETPFTALPQTPAVNGFTAALLSNNPNARDKRNGAGATNPFRLSPLEAATADQDHGYTAEQFAFNAGYMNLFPFSVGMADSRRLGKGIAATTGLTMGYYDGNTVTAVWNYAQHYAMSDHFFGTTFGPSSLGAINLISGQTNGVVNDGNAQAGMVSDRHGGHTLISNADPSNDICSITSAALVHMTGKNIGDLMNAAGLTWGFFYDGFDLRLTNSNGSSGCGRSHRSDITGETSLDYTPGLNPFQFYASTANPLHTRPAFPQVVGYPNDGGANHQYDLRDFFHALDVDNFPTVSFLKAPAYRDGHAGFSDPLDEQAFLVEVINTVEQSPEWNHTVIILAYDDSDGWYDHVNHVINGSETSRDGFSAIGRCGDPSTALPGVQAGTLHAQGRCGYGPRLPLLVISPWAKPNYVSHIITDQTSILRFIEDTFLNQQRIGQGSFDAIAGSIADMFDFSAEGPHNSAVLLLDPATGQVKSQ
jgi:phospholipase C